MVLHKYLGNLTAGFSLVLAGTRGRSLARWLSPTCVIICSWSFASHESTERERARSASIQDRWTRSPSRARPRDALSRSIRACESGGPGHAIPEGLEALLVTLLNFVSLAPSSSPSEYSADHLRSPDGSSSPSYGVRFLVCGRRAEILGTHALPSGPFIDVSLGSPSPRRTMGTNDNLLFKNRYKP